MRVNVDDSRSGGLESIWASLGFDKAKDESDVRIIFRFLGEGERGQSLMR